MKEHFSRKYFPSSTFVLLFLLTEMTFFYWRKPILTNISLYSHWVGILLITSSQVLLTFQQWENKNNTIWYFILKVSYKQIGKKNLWKTCFSYPTSTPTKQVTKFPKNFKKAGYEFIQNCCN